MPSDFSGSDSGSGDLPPHLDPRGGRPRRANRDAANDGYATPQTPPAAPLPPELDPRGRRAARQRAAAIQQSAPVIQQSEPAIQRDKSAGSRSEFAMQRDEPAGRDWRALVGDRKSALSGASLGLRIVAAALSLAVLLGSGIAWATYRNFTGNIRRVDIGSSTSAAAKNIDGSDQNILIVGNDDRDSATDAELKLLGTTRDGGSYNTDTMMLLHVPANGSKATAISFPRDSYVDIPGHGKDKLNAAYPDGVRAANGDKAGGARLLVSTIENLTKLSIDHFVQVDLLGFYRISNAIGGVTVCLNNAQGPATRVGQVGDGFDSGYEPDGSWVMSYSGINLPKGKSTIKGTQALAFVRQRHGLPGGDLDRIKRQQYFLSAVFRQLASAGTLVNPFKLESLLNAVTSSLTMDKTLDPLKLAQQMQNLSAGNVTFTTIPTTGFADISGVGNVVVVNTNALGDVIDTLIGEDPKVALANAKAVAPSSVTVAVLNASGVNGRATANTAALTAAGFKASVGAGDPSPLAVTTIRYAKGMESQAKTLAAKVPGATLVRASDVTTLTLVLGQNNVQVASLKPTATTKAFITKAFTAEAFTTKAFTSQALTTQAVTSQAGTLTRLAAVTPSPTVTTAADAGCIN